MKATGGQEFLLPRMFEGWDRLIAEAFEVARQQGFEGRYVRTITTLECENGYHGLAFVECEFDNPRICRKRYVVVCDSHIGGEPARLHAFTEAVHFLQNTTEENFWVTSTRARQRIIELTSEQADILENGPWDSNALKGEFRECFDFDYYPSDRTGDDGHFTSTPAISRSQLGERSLAHYKAVRPNG